MQSTYVSTKLKNVQRDKILDYLMNICEGGLYVALLKAKIGEATHAVGINTFLRKIYDCMEKRVMELTIDSLNRCCGPNMSILWIEAVAVLCKLKNS